MKSAAKTRNSSRLASRKIMAFYRKHIGPGTGVRIGPASKAVMVFLGADYYDGKPQFGALAAMAKHEGSLPVSAVSKPKPAAPSTAHKQTFYQSWEWATLRMKVLKANGGRCECCGGGVHDMTVGGFPVRLHVDHIKPISKFWELRLEAGNLQVLCAECNRGKGAWDATDWRRGPLNAPIVHGWK